jgi:solute carrier family 12 (sodium/potassium/chloride transporter), member 2
LFRGPGGTELPKEVIDELTRFTRKQRQDAVIDVFWLYDDGGLTLLLPYIISTRRNWNACRLRVFALANKNSELEFEQRSMASLLSKFRIDYSDLILLPDITKKPEESTTSFFDDLIKSFIATTETESDDCELFLLKLIGIFHIFFSLAIFFFNVAMITQADLIAVQDKTNRHLRLREHLLEHSSKSDLVRNFFLFTHFLIHYKLNSLFFFFFKKINRWS